MRQQRSKKSKNVGTGGTVCCVVGCRSNTKHTRNVSWHRFPKKEFLRSKWIKLVNRQDIKGKFNEWQPKYFTRICGLHFNKSGRRTPSDKFPIFIQNNVDNFQDVEISEKIMKTKEDSESIPVGIEIVVSDVINVEDTHDTHYNQILHSIEQEIQIPILNELKSEEHSYCLQSSNLLEEIKKLQKVVQGLTGELHEKGEIVKDLSKKNEKLENGLRETYVKLQFLKIREKMQQNEICKLKAQLASKTKKK